MKRLAKSRSIAKNLPQAILELEKRILELEVEVGRLRYESQLRMHYNHTYGYPKIQDETRSYPSF